MGKDHDIGQGPPPMRFRTKLKILRAMLPWLARWGWAVLRGKTAVVPEAEPPAGEEGPEWLTELRLPVWAATAAARAAGIGPVFEARLVDPGTDEAAVRQKYRAVLDSLEARQEAIQAALLPAVADWLKGSDAALLEAFGKNPKVLELAPYMREPLQTAKSRVPTPELVKDLLVLESAQVFDRRRDGEVYVGYRFTWEENEDRGIGVTMCGTRVVSAGFDDGYPWKGAGTADRDGGEVFV